MLAVVAEAACGIADRSPAPSVAGPEADCGCEAASCRNVQDPVPAAAAQFVFAALLQVDRNFVRFSAAAAPDGCSVPDCATPGLAHYRDPGCATAARDGTHCAAELDGSEQDESRSAGDGRSRVAGQRTGRPVSHWRPAP